MDQNLIWESVLSELRLALSNANFQTWFRGKTKILSVGETKVEIGCQNSFIRDWIEQRYYQQIKLSLDRILERDTHLLFSVEPSLATVPAKTKPRSPGETPLFDGNDERVLREKVDQAGLNPNYVFENFIVGKSNQLAHAVALSIAENPGKNYNPFFIYGGVGVGKTHLMQAIGNAFLSKQKNAKILYCTSEVFTNELIESIQKRNTPYFRNRFRRIDLLLIDDIQFIAGRESTQEEFFHTFNALYSSGKQIVLTSDRPPSEIKKLEERLKSRFEGGMIADIQNPDIDLREAILTSKCELQGQMVPLEVLRYIAQSSYGSVRDLEGCLVRITTRSKISNEPISVELAKKVIGSVAVETKPASAKKVMELVANFFGIKVADLKSGNRQSRYVQPRQICMYLLRRDLGLPLERIAELLGKKDHTTVLHGVDKVEKNVVNSVQLSEWLRQIRSHLG